MNEYENQLRMELGKLTSIVSKLKNGKCGVVISKNYAQDYHQSMSRKLII